MNNRTRNLGILLLVGLLLVGSIAVILTKPTKRGLDLKGGVELIYQAKATKQSEVTPDAINRAIDIMRERVDNLGVAEPAIQRSGSDQIDVALPDVTNAKRAEEQVGQVAQLFFYDWETNVMGPGCKPDPQNASVTGGQQAGDPATALSFYDAVNLAAQCPARNADTATTNGTWYLLDTKNEKVVAGPAETRADLFADTSQQQPTADQKVVEVKPGTVVVKAEYPDGTAKQDPNIARWYVLNDDPALLGTDIKNPEQNYNNGPGGNGQPIVTFDFTSKGRKIWQNVTKQIAQRGQDNQVPGQPALASAQHFAIVLDNELISTPYIDYQQNPDGIDASSGSQIEGGFTLDSARNLADLLKTGALPIKLELISQSQVSATLGQQALNQGLIAGIVGFAVVALFLLAFYRVLGLIAVGALIIYGIYFFALIKLIPITLTLPGIAGLILTLSVAADANIVIFERIKEEIRAGRSVPAGIAQGYKKGIAAIIDANVVTFMVAFILFMIATAGVKGFALTLGIGTLVSLFTAVLATQAVLGTMGNTRAPASQDRARRRRRRRERRYVRVPAALRLHGQVEVVLLLLRRHPARLRAGHRLQGPELRHRLPVGHAHHHRADAEDRRERRARRAGQGRLRQRRGAARQQQGAGHQRVPDLRRHRPQPGQPRPGGAEAGLRRARRTSPTRRSGRPSARPSAARRSSRSSRR